MPEFPSAARYRPGYARDGIRVLGPDEDGFSLAACVLERPGRLPSPAGPVRVHAVGPLPPVADWGLAALLDRPVELRRYPGEPAGLAEAREAWAEGDPARVHYLVVVDDGTTFGSDPHDAGAYAVRRGGGVPEGVSVPHPALDGRPGWRGPNGPDVEDLSLPSPRSVPVEGVEAFRSLSPAAVSEGAYVPRARYLENLPSRWRLAAERCGRCGAITFPLRGRCRGCGLREQLGPYSLPFDGGTVIAATTVGPGGQPTEFDAQVAALGEYGVVLAELAPGVRLTLSVADTDPTGLPIGSRLSTRLRRLYPMEGEWRYGRKAVPFHPPRAGESPD